MSKKSNFIALCEETLMRFQQGGFLEGDYVKLTKNWAKCQKLQGKAQGFMDMLDRMSKIDLPIKLSYIKSERPETSNGLVGSPDAVNGHWADIAVEYAPGLIRDVITVPVDVLVRVDTGNAFSPEIPKSLKRKDTTQIKPTVVKTEDPNLNLTKKNIKIKK